MRFRPTTTGLLPATLALLASLSGCSPTPGIPAATPTGSPASGSVTSAQTTDSAATSANTSDSAVVQLTAADLSELEQVIRSHAGKVVVVDIWSTSCAPCMREFPHLVELSKSHHDQLVCISFNVDYIGLKSKPPQAYIAKVQQFLQKQQAVDVTNLLSASTDESVLRQFGIGAIPAILIYAPDGELKHTFTDSNTGKDGLTYAGDVLPRVRELLPNS